MPYVADSGPLLAFARAQQLAVLATVLEAVLIPEAVYAEIVVEGAGKPGAEALQQAPWITRTVVQDTAQVDRLPRPLHRGEREALVLAAERRLPLVVDDRGARQYAQATGLAHLGSLRVLQEAKRRGVLPQVRPTLDALVTAGLYLSEALYATFLRTMHEATGPR